MKGAHDVLGLSLMWHLTVAWFGEYSRRAADEGKDRGELLQYVVMIAALVAATIVVVAIIVAKATDAANNVKTQ